MIEYHGFTRAERLIKNFEFKRTRNKGTSFRDGVFILTIYKNETGSNRLGLSISPSKLPLASQRNRLKRLIKEVFRLRKSEFKNGPYDILISLQQTPDCKAGYAMVDEKFTMLLKKAKVL